MAAFKKPRGSRSVPRCSLGSTWSRRRPVRPAGGLTSGTSSSCHVFPTTLRLPPRQRLTKPLSGPPFGRSAA
eukprot:174927-Alexandrium_andersonii.AAC.1